MKVRTALFSLIFGLSALAPVSVTYGAIDRTHQAQNKKTPPKAKASNHKASAQTAKAKAATKTKKAAASASKLGKTPNNKNVASKATAKKAAAPHFKLTYVTKNGKRIAVRQPVRATSKYAVYQPAAPRRTVTLQNRAETRGMDMSVDPLSLSTGAVLAYDLDSDKVLYEKNADEPMAIASITKLMTALVIVESKVNLDQKFMVAKDDVVESSARSKLRPGTMVSRRQALHLALMSSDNRAAHFLARTYPGGKESFIKEMNAKAVKLGMTDSVFYDSIGLHNGNKSSAMDLSHLIASAGEYRLIRELSTTPEAEFEIGNRTVASRTTNRFVLDPEWDVDLQKTGLTTAAGYCMVMRTNISGRNIAMVFLDAPNKSARNHDIEKLKDWLTSPGVFTTAMR